MSVDIGNGTYIIGYIVGNPFAKHWCDQLSVDILSVQVFIFAIE